MEVLSLVSLNPEMISSW